MKNLCTIAFLFFSLVGCTSFQSDKKTHVVYFKNHFYIPAGARLVGALGENSNHLIFRYGIEKSKNYVALSNLKEDLSGDPGCPLEIFYEHLYGGETNSSCDKNQLSIFRNTFIDDSEIEIYKSKSLTAYKSVGDSMIFIFVFDESGNAIKIESDLLMNYDLNDLLSH